jgi:outer membrane protein, heavy metal efflux system
MNSYQRKHCLDITQNLSTPRIVDGRSPSLQRCVCSWGALLVLLTPIGCTRNLPTAAYQTRLTAWQQTPAPSTSVETVEATLATLSPLDRTGLVRLVLAQNPGIAAARQAWRAALARYPQVTALDDPTLSYALAPRTIGSAAPDDVGQIIQLSQRLPFPGKRQLQGLIALAEADTMREDYEAVRLHLALMASQLFDDYYVVERALEINAQHLALLQDLQRSAAAQYIVGQAAQQDPIQAETEITHLMHQEVVLRTTRVTIVAQLNGLLHREPGLALPPPPAALPVPPLPTATSTDLAAEALRQRPEVRAGQARRDASAPAVQLAERQYYPDLTLMGTYNSLWEAPEQRFTVGVGVNLPVQRARRQAAVEEAQARQMWADQEYARLVDTVRVEVEQAYQRLLESHHAIRLYQDRLLPAAHDRIEAARVGFEAGRTTFLTVIDAEKNQRTVTLRYQELLADLYRRQAQLDRAVGRLPGLPTHGVP